MDLLLKAITDSKYGRKIYGGLKITSRNAAWLFLCEWDSRAKDKDYEIKIGPCEKTQIKRKSVSEINH
jgi:hypothetical protein